MKKLSFFKKITIFIASLTFLSLPLITLSIVPKNNLVNNCKIQVLNKKNNEQEIVDTYIDEDYGVIYTLDHTNKTATATGFSGEQKDKTKFVIQNAIVANHSIYQVKEIGDNAFKNVQIHGDIIIGDLVERIGNYAFYEAFEHTNIHMSNNIVYVGEKAFFTNRAYTTSDPLEFGTRFIYHDVYSFRNLYPSIVKFRYKDADETPEITPLWFGDGVEIYIPPYSKAGSYTSNSNFRKYNFNTFQNENRPMVSAAANGIDRYINQDKPYSLSVNENANKAYANNITLENFKRYVDGPTDVRLHDDVHFYVKEVEPLINSEFNDSILVTLRLDVNVDPSNPDYEAITRFFDGAERSIVLSGFMPTSAQETEVIGHEINLPQSIDIMNIPIDEIKRILYNNKSSILKNLPNNFNVNSFLNLTENNITRDQNNATIHIKDLYITNFYKKEGDSLHIENTTDYTHGLHIGEVNIKTPDTPPDPEPVPPPTEPDEPVTPPDPEPVPPPTEPDEPVTPPDPEPNPPTDPDEPVTPPDPEPVPPPTEPDEPELPPSTNPPTEENPPSQEPPAGSTPPDDDSSSGTSAPSSSKSGTSPFVWVGVAIGVTIFLIVLVVLIMYIRRKKFNGGPYNDGF